MAPRPLKLAASLAAITIVAACSKSGTGPSILGHWQAERVSVYSVQLPIGPDIVVSNNEVLSPDTGASVPVKGIESKGDSTTLDLPYGVGLTFYFDGPDRMYLKVPVVGHIYYRRVTDPVRTATQPATQLAAQPATARSDSQMPASAPGSTNSNATTRSAVAAGDVQYKLALIAARQGDTDAAIGDLNDALKAGFRRFDLLDAAPEMNALKNDVRYRALVARYH
jgi:hypothetical protein